MTERSPFRQGACDGIPVAVSFILSFLTVGALSQISGFSFSESTFMTIAIFAAPAQCALSTMLGHGNTLWAALVTVVAINSRFLVMAASLAPSFRRVPVGKILLSVPMLSASTFSVTRMNEGEEGINAFDYYLGVCLASFPAAIVSTALGYLVVRHLGDSFLQTAPMILPIYFSILIAKEWPKRKPVLIAGSAFLLFHWLRSFFQTGTLPIVSIFVASIATFLDRADA